MGPADLENVLKKIDVKYDGNVLVGFDKSDDAGVYRISDTMALVQTVDFFTPIVDDPFIFGQIAAANALSDVYAMGGKPLTAMNIVAFPLKKFSLDVLADILRGGLNILESAGVQLLGGHSVEDNELKYGLSVTGTIHPGRIIKNSGLMDGDTIILTKALGTGIIGTAVKAGMADAESVDSFTKSMTRLNRDAAEIMLRREIHACTDVTGFGLAGHLREMLGKDLLEIKIDSQSIPLLPGVKDYSEMGLNPAGLYRNRDSTGSLCTVAALVEQHIDDAIFDPQTSGGLLMAVPAEIAGNLLEDLHAAGIKDARIIASIHRSKTQGISIT